MQHDRRNLLKALIERSNLVSEILRQLSIFDFDSEPVLIVRKDDVLRVLSDYMEGKMSEADVAEWADAIEVRDDLGYPPEGGIAVKEAIHDLANPLLSGPLTPAEVQRLKSSLQAV